MRNILLLGVVTVHMAVSEAIPVTTSSDPLSAVTSSVNTFSNKFVEAISENGTKNLVSSPLSAYMALSMLTLGAGGNTETELRSVLGLPKGDFTERGIQSLVDGFANFTVVDLRLASNIFLANTVQPKTAFLNVTKTVLRSEAQTVDFRKSAEARKTINQWCEKKTDNHIKDLISSSDLSESTVLVLVNAVYFKANWSVVFDPEATKERQFNLNDGTIKNVKTMHDIRYLQYGEIPEVDAKFVVLPYESTGQNDEVSMIIILPNKVNGLVNLENLHKVNTAKLFESSLAEVDLHLPKFTIESTIDLHEPLDKMGLAGIFEGGANFSGIVDGSSVQVNKAIQKTFIEVNEAGSTAAAATYLQVAGSGPDLPIDFDVNRPFLSIIATRSGQPLFVSMVNDPTS